jgi:hypothetical protein
MSEPQSNPPKVRTDAEIDALPLTDEQKDLLKTNSRVVLIEWRLGKIENYINTEIGKEIEIGLKPIFTEIRDRLTRLEGRSTGGGGQSQGGGGLGEEIFKLIGKGFDAWEKRQGGGAVGGGLTDLDRMILSSGRQFQALTYKKMIKDFSAWSGIPLESVPGAVETAKHVAPKT